MPELEVWVRAGNARDAVAWDPWRKRWVVSCRAAAEGGRANRAVAELVAKWLGLPASSVRWVHAGSARAKVLAFDGLTLTEAERRLRDRGRPD